MTEQKSGEAPWERQGVTGEEGRCRSSGAGRNQSRPGATKILLLMERFSCFRGLRASRPHWSASRRPDRARRRRTKWLGFTPRGSHRRDADGSDRDGRDPLFNNQSQRDSKCRTLKLAGAPARTHGCLFSVFSFASAAAVSSQDGARQDCPVPLVKAGIVETWFLEFMAILSRT